MNNQLIYIKGQREAARRKCKAMAKLGNKTSLKQYQRDYKLYNDLVRIFEMWEKE